MSLAARIRRICRTFNVSFLIVLDRSTLIPSSYLCRFAFLSVLEIPLPFRRTPTAFHNTAALDAARGRETRVVQILSYMINGWSTSGCTLGIIAGAYRGYVNSDIGLRLAEVPDLFHEDVPLIFSQEEHAGGMHVANINLERDPFSASAVNRLIV